MVINGEARAWFKPGYAEILYADFYANYLNGFADPKIVFLEDVLAHNLSDETKVYLQWRIDGNGCPIIAWSAHLMAEDEFAAAGREILKAVGRPNAGHVLQTKVIRDGIEGYVMYVDRPSGPEHGVGRDPEPPPSQRKPNTTPTPFRLTPH
jgi:hypothetical protein